MRDRYHAETGFPEWMREDPEVRARVGMAPLRMDPLPTTPSILGNLGATVGRAGRALAERWPTPPIPYTHETRWQRFGKTVHRHVSVAVWWKSWMVGVTVDGWVTVRLGPVTVEVDLRREPWQ